MSYMRIFVIKKNGDLESVKKFGNSHRGGPLLWDWIERKYMPYDKSKWEFSVFIHRDKEGMDKFWKLVEDDRLPEYQRIALYHTYDGVMVKKENLKRLVDALEMMASDMEDCGHLLDQVDFLKGKVLDRNDILGICWQQSSTVGSAWGSEGVIYDENENSRPFNIYKDNYHDQHWLFDVLKLKTGKNDGNN